MKYEVNESGEIIKSNKQNYTFIWVVVLIAIVSFIIYSNSDTNGNTTNIDTKKSVTITKTETTNKDIDYSVKIRSFLKAEDNRNFYDVNKHFSSNMKKYWMYDYPSYSKLKEHYIYNWSKSKSSKNYILSIDRINKNTYNYTVQFNYHQIKDDKEMSIESNIRIVFDDNGKIEEVYGL